MTTIHKVFLFRGSREQCQIQGSDNKKWEINDSLFQKEVLHNVTDTDVAAAEELVKKAEFSLYRIQKGVLHNKVDPILWDIMKEQKDIHWVTVDSI